MTYVAVLLVLVAAVSARPQAPRPVPQIAQKSHVQDDQGQYSLQTLGTDGQFQQSTGELKLNSQGDGYVLVTKGLYRYVDTEGKPVEVSYVADENGYQPTGNIIHPDIAAAPAAAPAFQKSAAPAPAFQSFPAPAFQSPSSFSAPAFRSF